MLKARILSSSSSSELEENCVHKSPVSNLSSRRRRRRRLGSVTVPECDRAAVRDTAGVMVVNNSPKPGATTPLDKHMESLEEPRLQVRQFVAKRSAPKS